MKINKKHDLLCFAGTFAWNHWLKNERKVVEMRNNKKVYSTMKLKTK